MLIVIPRNAPFWDTYVNFARAAAEDLGLSMDVYVGNDDRLGMKKEVEERLKSDNPPKVILFNNFQSLGYYYIKLSDKYPFKALLVNSLLSDEQHQELGKPREIYKNWIGTIVPADKKAAVIATEILINKAITAHGHADIIGISGPFKNGSTMQRESGLNKVLAEIPKAKLQQLVNIPRMNRADAKRRFSGLRKRYPAANVVWSSNYRVFNGAYEASLEMGIVPGKQVFYGVLDIDDGILTNIADNKIVVATGGHYSEGAWATILAYDYLNGKDFAEETVNFTSPMAVITKTNVDKFREKFVLNKLTYESIEKIDFSVYSKAKNPNIDWYKFSMDEILSRI